jgi:hypothetical protein
MMNAQSCKCQNCEWRGTMDQLGCQLEDTADLLERVASGEIMPAGECPECGALAHLETRRMVMDEQTPLATPIARALDDLHDALTEVQRQGFDVQILIDAIGDLPIPAVRLSRDGESVWCGTEHLVGSGL